MDKDNKPVAVYWLNNSVYLNITNQCSNNCWFCFRNYKSGVGGFNLKLTQEPTLAEVTEELEKTLPARHWSEVVFCGFGEPTSRLDFLLETARWIKKHFLAAPIRLDTNGHGYALNKGRNVAEELKAAGVRSTSVSLNGENEKTYNEHCRPNISGAYQATLEFIRKAKAAGLEVEVSAVRIPEADMPKIRAIVDELGVPFRVRDYIPCFW
ncbi:MAG: TatD family nuclease-associated radical SAM protein [Candidatus Bathyarchaeota archaeon]|nr:TatD family nuclease-associated radical SAM protein [Candidatus Bathyarchaeota archaeon]